MGEVVGKGQPRDKLIHLPANCRALGLWHCWDGSAGAAQLQGGTQSMWQRLETQQGN